MKRLLPAAPVLALALFLAGCGGSHRAADTSVPTLGSPPATSSTGASTATTPGTGTTPTTTTSASGGTSPSGSAGTPRCAAGSLAGSFLGTQGATGHGEAGFALRNTGSTPCRTFGYPGVQFLGSGGTRLSTASTRTTSDFFGSSPEEALLVAPGGSLSFRLAISHLAPSPGACTTAYALDVIPPDDTVALRIPIPGGISECGRTDVSPLRTGTSAYP